MKATQESDQAVVWGEDLRLPMVSPADTGRRNRARVLRLLYAHGASSRSELARYSGAARAVIGTVVQPLIEDGLLHEGEPRPSGPSGGKGGRPLWFVDENAPIGALHVMPDAVHAAVIGLGGGILATHRVPLTSALRGKRLLDVIEAAIVTVRSGIHQPLRGIGVAVGGIVDTRTGEIVHVELSPHMDGLPLGADLAARTSTPVVVDGHPRAQALGDLWFGRARSLSSFVSIYSREGIGAGFVFDGELHRGVGGAGGEIGHTVVDLSGRRCRCGKIGCWDSIATVRWLRERASELDIAGAGKLTGRAVTVRAARGQQAAVQLLEEYAANLAVGIALVHQLLAPQAVLLHGDPAEAGETLRGAIEAALTPLVSPHPAGRATVVLAPDDDVATLRGAACLVLAEMLRFSI